MIHVSSILICCLYCIGAGLSSSSALVVASMLALLAAYGELDHLTKNEVAQLASRWVCGWVGGWGNVLKVGVCQAGL